jgi:hypothetical protein
LSIAETSAVVKTITALAKEIADPAPFFGA